MTNTENIFTENEDFNTTVGQASGNTEAELAAKERKHAIKSDVTSAVVSAVLSATPLVMDVYKHRKDPTPYKVRGGDIVRIAVNTLVPTVKAIDTAANKGKLQKFISDKTPFKFNDISNIINIIQLYPATHAFTKTLMENSMNISSGKPKIDAPVGTKSSMIFGTLNLFTPYIVNKMTDDELSFSEKVSSFVPIGMVGPWVKRLMNSNPKTRQIYDVTQAVVNVASVGNKAISGATRSNPNVTKATNQIGSVISAVQDLTGMNSGGGYGYNNYYGNNGWNNGSRWNSF